MKTTFEQREQLQRSQETLRGSQAEMIDRIGTKEQQVKAVRDSRDAVNEQLHALEIKLNTIDSESQTIAAKILEEHGLDIATVEAPRPDENLTDDAAREYLHQQKEQLRKFGAVNLLALDEYRTASEREKFLAEQLNDLTTARTDLQQTIQKINQTARQLFMETFEKARVNFKSLFQELFNGGESDIMLEDPNDPLESNIDIIARPRGKKLLSITMMSGGERALTAISLLFALYLVKPSPFCILDEIDAPLDDANCHRFLKIIRKFSNQTQFITITHNKITMEAADNLYGVTMEQPGVSKLVSVKFSEASSETASSAMIISDSDADIADAGNGNGNGHHQADGDDVELPPSIQERLELRRDGFRRRPELIPMGFFNPFEKLKKSLAKTKDTIVNKIAQVVIRRKIDDDLLDEIEQILIEADVGVRATMRLIEAIKSKARERRLYGRGRSDGAPQRGDLRHPLQGR